MAGTGRFWLLVTICIACKLSMVFAVEEVWVTALTNSPKDHVVKLDAAIGTPVMECELDQQKGKFTLFTWTKTGNANPLCTVASETPGTCDLGAESILEVDKRFNLKSKVKIKYDHSGEYGCTLKGDKGADITGEAKTLTVVGATTCPEKTVSLEINEKATLNCTVEYKGTKPTLTIAGPAAASYSGDTETYAEAGDPTTEAAIKDIKHEKAGEFKYTCKTTFKDPLKYTDTGCEITVTVKEKDGENAAVGLESKLYLHVMSCFIAMFLTLKLV